MNKLIFAAALSLAMVGQAAATVIGIAVEGIGSSTQVGTAQADGTIDFFVPLSSSESGTYGVDAGTSYDTCYYPGGCDGGTLDMFLRFDPIDTGPSVLELDFNDLDLFGVNDPHYFVESIRVYDGDSNPLGPLVNDFDDPGVVSADYDSQLLRYAVDVGSGPFFVELNFTSLLGELAPRYTTYRNTVESLLPTLTAVSVPEPATLSLLGAGLLGIGLMGRRRRQRK